MRRQFFCTLICPAELASHPAVNNVGKVPTPKLSKKAPPCHQPPAAKDQTNIVYINPQGNKPHTSPKIQALPGDSMGNIRLLIG